MCMQFDIKNQFILASETTYRTTLKNVLTDK